MTEEEFNCLPVGSIIEVWGVFVGAFPGPDNLSSHIHLRREDAKVTANKMNSQNSLGFVVSIGVVYAIKDKHGDFYRVMPLDGTLPKLKISVSKRADIRDRALAKLSDEEREVLGV